MKEFFSLILFIGCLWFIGCSDMEQQGKSPSFEEIYDKVERAVVSVGKTIEETDSLKNRLSDFYTKADSIKTEGIDIYKKEIKPQIDSLYVQIENLSNASKIFN